MNPVTHFLIGWGAANTGGLSRRERAAVAIAGIIPDADGFGMVADFLTRSAAHPTNWWGEYHHTFGHNLFAGLAVASVTFLLATRRWTAALLAFASFHLHLLGDLIGARGPDGDQWPIHYLWPLSNQPAQGGPVAAQRLAQLRHHRRFPRADVLSRLAPRLLAARNGIGPRRRRPRRHPARPLPAGRGPLSLQQLSPAGGVLQLLLRACGALRSGVE